mmetsp:Transcript_14626/g.29496  ORF Transcript_14626/g.29496 Transcript_14626/m.29496 type:complete len:82 (-) Transcript_14626:1118-1363(-)
MKINHHPCEQHTDRDGKKIRFTEMPDRRMQRYKKTIKGLQICVCKEASCFYLHSSIHTPVHSFGFLTQRKAFMDRARADRG